MACLVVRLGHDTARGPMGRARSRPPDDGREFWLTLSPPEVGGHTAGSVLMSLDVCDWALVAPHHLTPF